VHIRLILQPAWPRFVVWAFFLAVGWGALTTLESRVEIESNIVSAIFFGVIVAGFFTATSQATHRGAMEALSGLDQTGRSQAIDAVAHGVVSADPDVRASAIRLGRVWLRNKSADQLKRAEIWTWITFGLLFAAAVAAAAVNFNGDRLFYGVLALLSAITLLFSSLTMRRIRRNVALLAGRPQLGRR
jgi:hypothetical protein